MRSASRIGLVVLVVLAAACTSVTGPQDQEPKDDTDSGSEKTGYVTPSPVADFQG